VFRKRQLEAAARKRRSLSGAPSQAPARVDASGRAAREDIVAARRARREKQKSSTRAPQTSPARYKRKREESAAPVDMMEPIDPLDAQTSGLHDAAFDAGHEEITLNLEAFEAPLPEHEPDGAHQE